ncbi:MAG: glycogen synthase GlgA [Proteocatella sp.]
MNIVFVSSEASPFAKSGGLGDVMGALPKELQKKGVKSRMIMPLYKDIKEKYSLKLKLIKEISVQLAWRNQYCGIFKLEHNKVEYYFIDNEYYFFRDNYYGYYDDAERFAFFSKAAIDTMRHIGGKIDIINCNDWQCALIPVYLKTLYADHSFYKNIKTVFSIHNIEYQGKFNPYITGDILGLSYEEEGLIIDGDCINFMKGAIKTCSMITTVSPTYAKELEDPFFASGLSQTVKENSYKLRGILNGIDTEIFNPAQDEYLKYKYDSKKIEGKYKNKEYLQKELGLEVNRKIPMIAMVGRLVPHKGIDLVKEVFDSILECKVQIVILGTGDKYYEDYLVQKAYENNSRVSVSISFSPKRASQIYAASDMFLMPSKSEPCGLSQMIAARYGSIPVVRETGGLKDSIEPYNPERQMGNGITFKTYEAYDMLDAIQRALLLYDDKKAWAIIIKNAMESNFSWENQVLEYIDLYKEIIR